jgi:hypothetical protein
MDRIFASHLISDSRVGFCSRRSDVSRKSFHPSSTELRALFLELQHARMETPSGEGFPNFHTFSQHLQPPSSSVFVLSTYSDPASYLSVLLKALQLMTLVVVGSTYWIRSRAYLKLPCEPRLDLEDVDAGFDGLVQITDVRRLDISSIIDGADSWSAVLQPAGMHMEGFMSRLRNVWSGCVHKPMCAGTDYGKSRQLLRIMTLTLLRHSISSATHSSPSPFHDRPDALPCVVRLSFLLLNLCDHPKLFVDHHSVFLSSSRNSRSIRSPVSATTLQPSATTRGSGPKNGTLDAHATATCAHMYAIYSLAKRIHTAEMQPAVRNNVSARERLAF